MLFLVSLIDATFGDLQELTDITVLLLYIWQFVNCYWLHSQKKSRQQTVMVLLLWQVGLIANVKLHFLCKYVNNVNSIYVLQYQCEVIFVQNCSYWALQVWEECIFSPSVFGMVI